MAGIATETVSRTLSDFKDEGLIDKKASTIIILDLTRLAKMKNWSRSFFLLTYLILHSVRLR